jgi:hypothetical protein
MDSGCGGPFEPVCDAALETAGGLIGSFGQGAFDAALSALGNAFVSGAQSVAAVTFDALDSTTRIDLGAAWFQRNLAVIAVITLPVVVGLFVLQVIGSVIRREPGGLVRAVTGVGKALLGSGLAIALTGLALRVSDEISAAIASTGGTSVGEAAERFFRLTWLSGPGVGPVLQMLLAGAIIIGSLLLWTVLLFRKAALLLVAVFAPVAFAGYGWDQTRIWARRWIEAVVALVFCKVVIVVVFVLGASAFGTDGTTATEGSSTGAAASLSDILTGLLVLSIAVLSPWLTWRFVHWAGGEIGTSVTDTVAATPVPAAVRTAGSQARWTAQSVATTAALGAISGGAGAAAGAAARGSSGAPPPPGAWSPTSPPPPAAPPTNGSDGGSRG